MSQLSYTNQATKGREGQIADAYPSHVDAYVVEGSSDLKVGLLVDQGTNDRQCTPMAALPAVDADGIKLAFASVVAAQDYDSTDLDGAIGQGRIIPARSITFTADAHADWGVGALGGTWIKVDGEDAAGNPQQESMFLPANGGVTLTTDGAFSRVTSVHVGANDGTGGSGTVGVSNTVVEVGKATNPGVVVYDPMSEPNSVTAEYTQYESVNMLRSGRFLAVPEHAVVEGESVFVRVLLAGADVRGQFTGDTGAVTPGTYAKVLGARWREAAAADGLAMIEINF